MLSNIKPLGFDMVHAQKKGKRGEVELCEWIDKNLYPDDPERTVRNILQADGTSTDIIVADFMFEVKRQEKLDLDSWWLQVVVAKKNHHNKDLIPVVAFRQNRKKWRFLIPANLLPNVELGYMEVNEKVFLQFAKGIVD